MGVDQRTQQYIEFYASLTAEATAQPMRGVSSCLDIIEQEWPLVGEESSSQTRGSVTESLENLQVGMFAHSLKEGAVQAVVMSNNQFQFVDKEEMEATTEPVLWESVSASDSLRVYGYSPYAVSGNDFTIATASGKTTITYTVPNAIADQQDIIATDVKEVVSNYKKNIPLTFRHILTGVRFKVGFDCRIKSLKVVGVHNSGRYTIGDAWREQSGQQTYTLPIPDGGLSYTEGEYVSDEILMMIPQQLPSDAKVVMEYDNNQTLTAPLAGLTWNNGALVTYTLHQKSLQTYIYFDLAAGPVEITPTYCSGSFYYQENGATNKRSLKFSAGANYDPEQLHVYIYQSTEANKAQYGYLGKDDYIDKNKICRIPVYQNVKVGNKSWSDFITNNSDVESVIEAWDTENNIKADANSSSAPDTGAAVRQAGRTSTPNAVTVKGDGTNKLNVEITLDNIYSRVQSRSNSRTTGGLVFTPDVDHSSLTVNLVGDNRAGCVHYFSGSYSANGKTNFYYNNELIFQGSGSLTAACVDFYKTIMAESKPGASGGGIEYHGDNVNGYASNHWCSAIGGNDGSNGHAIGIKIKSGTIFAGTTQTENCTAIGGGGNDIAYVTIEGGVVTAVSTTTGTAIGGGIGFHSGGGVGNVTITGGTVYAYNHANEWEIPSAAIGSAGSMEAAGGSGTVTISGGYVYAQTALGTAIGGGSSKAKQGGNATVKISGNSYVIAKSISAKDNYSGDIYPAGNGIGGGTGGEKLASDGKTPAYGGSATVTISGNPIIRTGSIGGGKTNNPAGKLGRATINISGGDISAQFVMAGGADSNAKSEFTMSGGTISNSDVHSVEFYHVQPYGGAVYMEDGVFKMSGAAKIRNCNADIGGAVYISKSANAVRSPEFYMMGGTIENCLSASDGGAVFLNKGSVEMTDGEIKNCIASNGNGGGIFISEGNFKMSGNATKIVSNSALHRDAVNSRNSLKTGDGGGIYVTSAKENVNVDISSGIIEQNTCDQNGGGVCVYMDDTDGATTEAIINIGTDAENGPKIDNNKAILYGGGMYAKGVNAKITINGGSISNNSVSNYVPNEDVSNEGGTVKLYNGEVSHKIVRFDMNTKNPDDTAMVVGGESEVKIVTATNSFLVAPSAERSLYNFVKWSLRRDGEGESYNAGDIINVNLTEDLTLYAIWQAQ